MQNNLHQLNEQQQRNLFNLLGTNNYKRNSNEGLMKTSSRLNRGNAIRKGKIAMAKEHAKKHPGKLAAAIGVKGVSKITSKMIEHATGLSDVTAPLADAGVELFLKVLPT